MENEFYKILIDAPSQQALKQLILFYAAAGAEYFVSKLQCTNTEFCTGFLLLM